MKPLLHWLALAVAALLLLQLFFVARIAMMATVNPQSSAFERSEAWRILNTKGSLPWRQEWVDYEQMSDHLKRAVIAAEDDGFSYHDGVQWDALEKAWQKNSKAEEQMTQKMANGVKVIKPLKIFGGSTITQQLAKNLFLSGERTLLRKGQELVLTFLLEKLLDKERILTLYLNHVEWGEGIFGAEAAAQHYFRKPAARLTPLEAARLAVMLPRPKYFEKLPNSAYLAARSATIAMRLKRAELP